jgi:hypothetical protein
MDGTTPPRPQYVFMAWYLIMCMDNLTLYNFLYEEPFFRKWTGINVGVISTVGCRWNMRTDERKDHTDRMIILEWIERIVLLDFIHRLVSQKLRN